jgi:hypothetical protein
MWSIVPVVNMMLITPVEAAREAAEKKEKAAARKL